MISGVIASGLDRAPDLGLGRGRLDLGLAVSRDLVGGSARADWRLGRNLSAFGSVELGYSFALRRTEGVGLLGARLTW